MWEGLGAATQDESPRLPACPSAANLMSQAARSPNCCRRLHLVRLQPGTPGHQSWGAAKFSSKLLFSWIRFQGGRKERGLGWQMSGEGVQPTQPSRWLGHILSPSPPKKMFSGKGRAYRICEAKMQSDSCGAVHWAVTVSTVPSQVYYGEGQGVA